MRLVGGQLCRGQVGDDDPGTEPQEGLGEPPGPGADLEDAGAPADVAAEEGVVDGAETRATGSSTIRACSSATVRSKNARTAATDPAWSAAPCTARR